jgi:uncharacterized protein (DUF2147 family)
MGAVSPVFCIASLSWITAMVANLLAAPLLASTSPDISGNWLRTDGTARIKIASCGAQICAVNTWIKDTIRDERVGDRLVMTLEPLSDSKLFGAAFDVRRNRSYSIDITIDRNSMQTRGCLIKGIVCKTMSWNRTALPEQPPPRKRGSAPCVADRGSHRCPRLRLCCPP